ITPSDTPYGDLLRVRLAKTESKEWERRQTNILRAIASDRREDLMELFSGRPSCQIRRRPPTLSGTRDLLFAYAITGALARPKDGEDSRANLPPSKLPLSAWRSQYAALLHLIEESGTAWWYLPALLSERGDFEGSLASETPEYQHVTELARRHLQE